MKIYIFYNLIVAAVCAQVGLRKISPFYSKHESNNIWSFNMANWFNLLSEIRHAIIHNRQELTEKVKETIAENNNMQYFDRYFLSNESFTKQIIYTDRVRTGEQICLFNQYAHLIFKSLSLEAKLDSNYYN